MDNRGNRKEGEMKMSEIILKILLFIFGVIGFAAMGRNLFGEATNETKETMRNYAHMSDTLKRKRLDNFRRRD